MTVLVTGSNGFLGTSLVERLAEHGEKHIRCFLREGGNQERINSIIEAHPSSNIELFYGTLSSKDDCVRALEGVKTLYHLAGIFTGAISDMFSNTVVTTKVLFEAVNEVKGDIDIVFISSFSVYGVSHLPKGYTINEETPLETKPEKRDPYTFVKSFQEKMVKDYQKEQGFRLVILRPGVIYGPHGGGPISPRVGLNIGGVFLHLGGRNLIPLSYVDNCAEAIAVCGANIKEGISIYNVHDNELPTSGEYLKAYQKAVKKLRTIRVPYFMLQMISRIVQWYHTYSKGQLPDIFTPYKSAAMWKGNKFDNSKLRSTGWKPIVTTEEGMRRTFEGHKAN